MSNLSSGHNTSFLLIVLILALSLRIYGINWDQGYMLHPDERMIAMVAIPLSLNNLNPDFYNYGSLPIYILKAVSSAITFIGMQLYQPPANFSDFPNILLVGRAISALFDVATVLLIYLIGKQIKNEKFGLVAAFFYSISVFPIQNAHFYIVDPQMTTWIMLTILFAIKAINNPKSRYFAFMGITSGLAAATKFTGILALSIPILLILIGIATELKTMPLIRSLRKHFLYLVFTLLPFIAIFLITQPYVAINVSKYWEQVSAQLRMNSDPTVFPYTIQFIGTPAYLHPLKGIVIWGLGLPLGVIAILGLLFMLNELARTKDRKLLILLAFFTIFFGILGRSSVKFMRYYLPLYPILALSAAYTIYVLYKRIQFSLLRNSLLLFIGACVLLWPLAFMNVYAGTNPRVDATNWINSTFPPGTTIATEHWDDIVPLRNPNGYKIQQIGVYEPETVSKWQNIESILDESDYFIISSKRVYKSILNWPEKYTITSRFYKDLFSGKTDFVLYKTFTRYPKLPILDLEISDKNSPESLTIFDHPTVYIFKKDTKRYNNYLYE